jgi:hypothetical protein
MKMQNGMKGVPASGNGEDGCSVMVPVVCLRPFLLLSFAFSPGSGNAEGSSNDLGDFPLLLSLIAFCLL